MEAYTNLNPVDEEKLQPLKEGVFSLPNQNVLDKLSEDAEGNLLYNNKPLGRAYKTFAVKNGLLQPFSSGDGVVLYANAFPDDNVKEIKSIRYNTTSGWKELKNVFLEDVGNAMCVVSYIVPNGVTDVVGGYYVVAYLDTQGVDVSASDEFSELLGYGVSEYEIDYYTD